MARSYPRRPPVASKIDIPAGIMEAPSHHESHLLPRSHFLLVFLGRTGLGGIEAALRGQIAVWLEARAQGRLRPAKVAGAVRMVLSAQRHHYALAIPAPLGLVRTGVQRISRAEPGGRS